jgi:hypothetical protein
MIDYNNKWTLDSHYLNLFYGEGPDYWLCSDCHSEIPRIHRLTDAYYTMKTNGRLFGGLSI